MQRSLKVLGILATFWILLALIAGALVTKTGSGEGCGANWPLCYGQLIPDNPTIETVIEYTHRLVTGIAGILVLAFSVICLILYRKYKEVVWVAISSLFFLLLQSALGAFAVLGIGRQSAVLALHFGFSLMSYASVFLLLIYVYQLSKNRQLPTSKATPRLKLAILGLFVYTYIVVYFGAFVRHTGSALACEGWPLCNGQLIPELQGQVLVHFIHRTVAFIILILFAWLLYVAFKHYRDDKIIVSFSLIIFVLAILQAISGAVMVLNDLHIIPSMLHAFFISILFGLLFYLLLYVNRKSPSNHLL
ncbi:COX15/CtaA family protein [Bacillus horti]|uniref:Cytochrome c oxidase assembly protein subunit 15 n=1 Tax=Caldalkalibacillus horti TaxID=77523 RepID=A0ABT9W289_9BACI|nr:COX15/CtaA family protein [Bacillus horti]MDQ0167364.1 cytochrome c oxidase assembly protein subunit 15 [Bacillus horti]